MYGKEFRGQKIHQVNYAHLIVPKGGTADGAQLQEQHILDATAQNVPGLLQPAMFTMQLCAWIADGATKEDIIGRAITDAIPILRISCRLFICGNSAFAAAAVSKSLSFFSWSRVSKTSSSLKSIFDLELRIAAISLTLLLPSHNCQTSDAVSFKQNAFWLLKS